MTQADEYLLQKTVIENPYIPWTPHVRQAQFLVRDEEEVMYGGAAGGGKSVSLLAAALQFAHVPGYAAILIRRTFKDLNQPKALISLSHEFLDGKRGVKWDAQGCRWRFDNGATLSFGYLDNERDKEQYQGAAFQFCAFDELTQFQESWYRYLFSRLRKPDGMPCPIRMRSGSNPGGIGHDWVRRRFLVEGPKFGRIFVSARLDDNPSLDADYRKTLDQLDPVTRARLLEGDWAIRPEGNLFKREWFTNPVEKAPPLTKQCRAWDLAATAPEPGKDPDYTVGVKMGMAEDKTIYITSVIRFRATANEVQKVIKQTAAMDGRDVSIRMEQEPGASGKSLIDHYSREVLLGYDFRGVSSTGDKVTRANPLSAACERRGVKLVLADWNAEFIDELTAFNDVAHDDQVDAASGAFAAIADGIEFASNFYTL